MTIQQTTRILCFPKTQDTLSYINKAGGDITTNMRSVRATVRGNGMYATPQFESSTLVAQGENQRLGNINNIAL